MSTEEAVDPPGVRDEGRRTLFNEIIKDKVIWEKYSRETGGEYARARIMVSHGGGTFVHFHRSYTETFFTQSGVLGVEKDGKILSVPAGESAHVPIGAHHRFFNDSGEDVTFVVELRPGHQGFERGLYIMYGLANDGLCDDKAMPLRPLHQALIANMSDMYIPGPFSFLGVPFVKLMAAYGRWSGEEERLLKKYWY